MTTEHPIIPPPELVVEWADTIYQQTECGDVCDLYVATQAARWGADQELEACCEWFRVKGYHPEVYRDLRAARRPTPPTLKEQALKVLEINNDIDSHHFNILRRALESLPD